MGVFTINDGNGELRIYQDRVVSESVTHINQPHSLCISNCLPKKVLVNPLK